MKLEQLKRPYDLIVSLGSSCAPAGHLRRRHLRKFSMPFDWVVSFFLADVNRVLKRRFEGYMDLNNLRLIEGAAHFMENEVIQPVKSYFVKDTDSNILSVHDFPVIPGEEWSARYPIYKEKLKRRADRLLDNLANCRSALFIRWAARYEDVVELQAVLAELTTGEVRILVLNPDDLLQDVVEADWGLENVCVLNVPNRTEDEPNWDSILEGITLHET